MCKCAAWMISPLLWLPLAAQEVQVYPPLAPTVQQTFPPPPLPVPLPQNGTEAPAPLPVLPDLRGVSPGVDMLTPVPGPGISPAAFGPVVPGAISDMAVPQYINIDNYGGGQILFTRGADGNFVVRYSGPGVKFRGDNGLEAFADSAVYDRLAETATFEGNVSVYQGNSLQRGERAVYYYKKKYLDTTGLRALLTTNAQDPSILLEAGRFTALTRGKQKVLIGKDAGITTDDQEDPSFWMRANKTTIYPGKKVVFNNLKFYAGDTPVFWLPYLSQPLDKELGYHVLPGARSSLGAYIQNSYGMMLGGKYDPETGDQEGAWLLGRGHLDLYSKRGAGVGIDFVDTRLGDSQEFSGLTFYYLNDLAPETTRSGEARGIVDPERYRIELKHRLPLKWEPDADWRIDSNLTYLSDAYYLQDFDPQQYRNDPVPDNTLGLYRRDDASLFSLYARFRVNEFDRTDTRLPEIAFDKSRAPILDTPILHEGSTSLGIIGETAGDATRSNILDPLLRLKVGDPRAQSLLGRLSGFDRTLAEKLLALPLNDRRRDAIKAQLLDSSYARFNTYQELSMPQTLGNFLQLTPEAGFGYTRYAAVDGPVEASQKTTLHAGLEASAKFSKDYAYKNRDLGLDDVKHILQPYAHWSVVSTNDFELGDPQIDRLTPTTRPRPLDPTRFTAVDELQSWNVVRLGARNRLLTHRDGQSYEWLYMDTYIDAFLRDPEGKRDLSNLYNDIRWQPLPWLSVNQSAQFPVGNNGSGFTEFASSVNFMPTQSFQFSLGHRYLNGHPVLTDSDRIFLRSYLRLSENWGVGTQHTYELADSTLELEQYSLHHDLGSWVAAVGLTHRDNRIQEEYGIIFSLTSKDFPTASLPFELNN